MNNDERHDFKLEATVSNMKKLEQSGYKHAVMVCDCGGEFSAHSGDYWNVEDGNRVMQCECGNDMWLGTRVTLIEPYKATDLNEMEGEE